MLWKKINEIGADNFVPQGQPENSPAFKRRERIGLRVKSRRDGRKRDGWHRPPACAVGRLARRNGLDVHSHKDAGLVWRRLFPSGRRVADRHGRVARATQTKNTFPAASADRELIKQSTKQTTKT